MAATYTLPGVLLSGLHAARPAANAVAAGTLYAETDTYQVYQSDGSSTWSAWGPALTGTGLAGGTPALTLGTANSAGAASTGIRTDATILAFDATVPAALGTAAAGAATVAARRDHVHPISAGTLLAIVYNVTGGNKTTTSATMADVDATNSAITFTAPASGNVLVRVTAAVNINGANQNCFFGLREGTTNLVNSGGSPAGTFAIQGQTVTSQELLVPWSAYLTGVSAGSHTYKLAFAVNGGASFIVRQGANQPVVLEVWACP